MFAIVQAGGRQEKVVPGTVIVVDRIDAEPGSEYTFDRVLLIEQADGAVVTGAPFVKGATVTGVIEKQTQAKKIRVFKTKRRKHFKKAQGHRTQQTRVKVTAING
ncbi:MAG: 50S ribosomal protein L21 [Acidobacteria bacterium]|nr:MAG: 50S ribosomal protein L21 [Acidobacteriota bacterium]